MASDRYTLRSIVTGAVTGACIIALGCGFQAAFAPTVRVSCPARTSAAPDCDLRWFVAFDMLTVRHTPLPALQPVGEIFNARRGSGDATTLYLNTAAGKVRTVMWGDHMSLQDLRDPLQAYFADAHAPAIDVTMWPSRWVNPGEYGPDDKGRRAHPIRLVGNALVIVGLLFWIWLPVQLAVFVARRS